jgi:hypothetical protein
MATIRRNRFDVLARIERLLCQWEDAERQPDPWESGCMLQAMDSLHEGELERAARSLAFAEFPHELRPPAEVAQLCRMAAPFSIDELRDSLEEIKTSRRLRPVDRGSAF